MSLIEAVARRIQKLKLTSEIPTSLELITPLPKGEALTLLSLGGEEKINDCFAFELSCISPKITIDFKKLLGQKVSVIFRYGDKDAQMRYIHGIVGQIRQGETHVDDLDRQAVTKPKKFKITQMIDGSAVEREVTVPAPETAIYLTLYPALWTTKFNKNFRIFQAQTALEMIKSVLGAHESIEKVRYDLTQNNMKPREYCVQYNESDYDFLTRLMAEEGLFFYHTHTKVGHELVIADGPQTHQALKDPQKMQTQDRRTASPLPNHIQALELCEQTVIDNTAVTDFNFKTPAENLFTLQGKARPVTRIYHYPGRAEEAQDATGAAKNLLEHHAWQKSIVQGSATVFGFQAGVSFKLADHVRKDANKAYVIHTVRHDMTMNPKKGHLVYHNTFIAFDHATPFRPSPFVKKPVVPGTQTAIVTGQSGEEIWTDEQGRVKVQFHWDQAGKRDEATTCWLRVQQVWAGNNWGFLFIPRIGMEVVVSFLNGDPDRPIVTGCLYNQDNPPPQAEEGATCSMIRTQSTKKESEGRFHELRFDDTLNAERIYVRTPHDLNSDIQHERTTDIHDAHDLVTLHAEKGDAAHQVTILKQGNKVVMLEKGDHQQHLSEGNMVQVLTKGNKAEVISEGNRVVALGKGNAIHTVGGNVGLTCNEVGVISGPISLIARKGGGKGGAIEVTGAWEDDGETRYNGETIPTVADPENPAADADAGKVAIQVEKLDVDALISDGNLSLEVKGGDRKTKISGNDDTTVQGNVKQQIKGNYELVVGGDCKITISGNLTIAAAGIKVESKMATAVKAGTSLDLKATTAWAGAGLTVDLSAQTTLKAAGTAQATVSGSGMLSLQGGVVKIN